MKSPFLIVAVVLFLAASMPFAATPHECVILLHGLIRSKKSMAAIEKYLSARGYDVVNAGYDSRSDKIEDLAETILSDAILECRKRNAKKIHLVTHSMGGILVRCYLKQHKVPELRRVVMISPPNGGSEVVDELGGLFLFKWLNGTAGRELGTADSSLPKKLGPVDFDLGVITGDRSVSWILSLMIPGPDDGKVGVESAKVKGMKDFLVIHATHTFIMRNRQAMEQVVEFLNTGKFQHAKGNR